VETIRRLPVRTGLALPDDLFDDRQRVLQGRQVFGVGLASSAKYSNLYRIWARREVLQLVTQYRTTAIVSSNPATHSAHLKVRLLPVKKRMDGSMARVKPLMEKFAAASSCSPRPECSYLRLLSPPDPLTRSLMEADGVSEADLNALVRKIATVLADREPSCMASVSSSSVSKAVPGK
jgi:hypothetical protein